MDRIEPKWTKWTEYDHNGPNMTIMDQIRLKSIKVDRIDQIEPK